MKVYLFLAGSGLLLASCKMPSSNRNNDEYDEHKVYRIHLAPPANSSYYFNIENESNIELEVNGKDAGNSSKSETGVNYRIDRDSSNNVVLHLSYDKIHMKTKQGDTEKEVDAANGENSIDPLERMLAAVKNASIDVVISPTGEVLSTRGYNEMKNKLIAATNNADPQVRAAMDEQLNKVIGDGMISNNINQFFKIFPDSAVHLHDVWRLTSRQGSDLPMTVKNTFQLKAINSDIAVISSKGVIDVDDKSLSLLSNGATGNLSGEQEGEYEIDTKTGMMLTCTITSDIKGTLQWMGREIPVTIKTKVKTTGTKKE